MPQKKKTRVSVHDSVAVFAASFLSLCAATLGHADGTDPGMPPLDAERPNVKLNVKNWNEERKSELHLLQDRTYSLRHKIEFGVLAGLVHTDPFLSVNHYGGFIGYHFNDAWGLGVLAWAYSVGPSTSLTTLEQQGTTANTNAMKHFYGAEMAFSPLYGKLSLFSKAILYFDVHLTAGAGDIVTETGSYFAPMIGVGEQFFIFKSLTLRIDFRVMYYSEMLPQKNSASANYGNLFGPRGNITDAVNLGISYLL